MCGCVCWCVANKGGGGEGESLMPATFLIKLLHKSLILLIDYMYS